MMTLGQEVMLRRPGARRRKVGSQVIEGAWVPQTIRRAQENDPRDPPQALIRGTLHEDKTREGSTRGTMKEDNARDNVALRGVRKGLDKARGILLMDRHTR